MQPYPHRYPVQASAEPEGTVIVSAAGLPRLETAAPAQYGGPGDRWSPETLLVGAAADCLILTFRSIATASKLPWKNLRCDVEGLLDRVGGSTRFTQLVIQAHLVVPAGTDVEKARRLLEKAEKACLVTNSLALTPTLSCEVEVA